MSDDDQPEKSFFEKAADAVGTAASYVDAESAAVKKTIEGARIAADAARKTGAAISEKAIASAVNQLISTTNYACGKISESDATLPLDSKLTVTAEAGPISLSLEVPVPQQLKQLESES